MSERSIYSRPELMLSIITSIFAMTLSVFMLVTRGDGLELTKTLTGVAGIVAGVAAAYMMIFALHLRPRPSVFISYCHADQVHADEIVRRLDKTSARVFVDTREMLVGDSISQRINEFVDKADFIILVISKNWAESEWAKRELAIILNSQKRILPVVLDADAIPDELNGIKYADLREDTDKGLEQVMYSIHRSQRHAEYATARPQKND